MAKSAQIDTDGSRYPLRRAFLMLSLPFTALLVFVLLIVFGDDQDNVEGFTPGVAVERRMEGIRATDNTEAGLLVDAWDRAPTAWGEEQLAAFRSLVERTSWPDEEGRSAGVTRSILLTYAPSEWNEAERASAKRLLDLFERYWFRPSDR